MKNNATHKGSSKGEILYSNSFAKHFPTKRLSADCRPDEAIVYFDKTVNPHKSVEEKMEGVKKLFGEFDHEKLTCPNCDVDIPLYRLRGEDIHTKVADSLPGGTGGHPHPAGEFYFPNFLSRVPHSGFAVPKNDRKPPEYSGSKENVVTVAVLDTGVDTKNLVHPDYICGKFEKKNMPCFSNIKEGGWNFVDDNDDYFDDSKEKHGSLVSQYIINQFTEDSRNGVKIMPLKTHDKNGDSDLISIICAIHFAKAKGANIINASWGFYYYCNDNRTFYEYFKRFIGRTLREKGILFVTAAGNRIPQEDSLAKEIYESQYGVRPGEDVLRDLGRHKYFPAHLSVAERNIVTVTTTNTDGTGTSPEQNHSNIYVDLGVQADAGPEKDPRFAVPFKLSSGSAHIPGSSFATAIATGVIGANCDKELYKRNISKVDFIGEVSRFAPQTLTGMPLFSVKEELKRSIKNGVLISNYMKAP